MLVAVVVLDAEEGGDARKQQLTRLSCLICCCRAWDKSVAFESCACDKILIFWRLFLTSGFYSSAGPQHTPTRAATMGRDKKIGNAMKRGEQHHKRRRDRGQEKLQRRLEVSYLGV